MHVYLKPLIKRIIIEDFSAVVKKKCCDIVFSITNVSIGKVLINRRSPGTILKTLYLSPATIHISNRMSEACPTPLQHLIHETVKMALVNFFFLARKSLVDDNSPCVIIYAIVITTC